MKRLLTVAIALIVGVEGGISMTWSNTLTTFFGADRRPSADAYSNLTNRAPNGLHGGKTDKPGGRRACITITLIPKSSDHDYHGQHDSAGAGPPLNI